MSSFTLLRSTGFAFVLGGVLSFNSSTGALHFLILSLLPNSKSSISTLALVLASLGWLLLATGLIALGIYLQRETTEENGTMRLLAVF